MTTHNKMKTNNTSRKHAHKHIAVFHGCKNDNFQLNFFDYCHIIAQNIDCGYTLEPPHGGGSNEYPQFMF